MTDAVSPNFNRERWHPDIIVPKGAWKQVRLHQFANEGLEIREWYKGRDGLWYASGQFMRLQAGQADLVADALKEAVQKRKGAKGGYLGQHPTPPQTGS